MPEEPAAPPAAPAEAPPAAPPVETPPPEPILGKFKSQDDLVKAYQELERKQSAPPAPAPSPEGMAIGTPDPNPAPAYVPLDQALTDAGVDVNAAAQQFATTGAVDEATMAAARTARPGASDAQIMDEAKGKLAEAELKRSTVARIQQDAATIVGGEEQLQNLLAQAKEFVPAHEIGGLNKQLNDPVTYKGALHVIMDYQKQAQNTTGSRPIIGGGGPTPATAGYATNAEWYEAAQARAKDRATPEQIRRLAATDPAVIQSINRPG